MKSYSKPTPELIDSALAKLTSIQLRRHFYSKLENPFWAEELYDRGVFKAPPKPLVEGNSVRYLDWPELEYVKKVAGEVPETAANIVSNIDTDNFIIQEVAIDIATKLPIKDSSAFVNKTLIKWYEGDKQIAPFVVSPILELAKHLASEQSDSAFTIIEKCIFSFYKDENASFDKLKNKIWREWTFKDAVKILQEPFGTAFGTRYLEFLCEQLSKVLALEGSSNENYSIHWRNAIEDHEQDKYHENPKSIIVSSIRDLSLNLIVEKPNDVFSTLAKHSESIFRRLEIYLSGATGIKTDSILKWLLSSPESFWSEELHHEIFHFLKQRFSDLAVIDQTQILELISKGPSTDKYKDIAKSRKYAALEKALSGKYLEDYSLLPKDDHPDLLIYSEGGWVGPNSPITDSEISKMGVTDLVVYLKTWKPSGGWHEATPRGLGRLIEVDVKNSPNKYLDYLPLFKISQPTYVGHVLSGIQALAKELFTEKAWSSILDLCEWIVMQPIKIEGHVSSDSFNDDPDWQWTRQQIASLLDTRLRTAPLLYRQRIWALISTLISDDDPTREDDRKAASGSSGYGIAINSTKGRTLHAAVDYGLWLHDFDKTLPAPELFDLINSQITGDCLLSQLSVIGRFFPWLHLMSKEWAKANLNVIFPENDNEKFCASWEAYISHCDPYKDVFDILQSKYLYSLKHQNIIKADHNFYASRLASHIVIFYLWKKIDIQSPIISAVLTGETAKQVFSYLGDILQDEKIGPEEVKLGQLLWDKYIKDKVKDKNISKEQSEILAYYSGFVVSKSVDQNWKFENLKYLLDQKIKLHDESNLISGFADVPDNLIPVAFTILDKIVSTSAIDYFVEMHQEDLRKLIEKYYQSNIEEIRKPIKKLINALGEKGYKGFEQFLVKNS